MYCVTRNCGVSLDSMFSTTLGAEAQIKHDPHLAPYRSAIEGRLAHFEHLRSSFPGGLQGEISLGHQYFGLNRGVRDGIPGLWYREWAPAASSLSLIGEFNGWDRDANPMTRDKWGIWHLFLPDDVYATRFVHGSLHKVHVRAANGGRDRIPAYARRVVQDPETQHFMAQYWHQEYAWKNSRHRNREPANPSMSVGESLVTPPQTTGGLRIYEAHVGMAQE